MGVYDELSYQRLDLIVSEAGKNGIYLILPLVNHWGDLGGMQWYVDQVRLSLASAGASRSMHATMVSTVACPEL